MNETEEKRQPIKQEMQTEVSQDKIQNMVYVVRGQQVMLDSDLAMLYQVETKRLNEAVKRNVERFPIEFRFQLNENEYDVLRSQFATSKEEGQGKGGRRYLPYVFTEQGIAMLSAVLKSDVAVKVSISIMNAFVTMRKVMMNHAFLLERVKGIELRQMEYEHGVDEKLAQLFDYFTVQQEISQRVFFNGQIYDAFSIFVELVKKADNRIVLVDNYVDIDTLNIISKKKNGVCVCIYTKKKSALTERDVEKFNKQYPKLELKYTGVFHDRFLILDDTEIYHIGASLKDAGKKCFAISLLHDKKICGDVLQRLKLEAEN